MKVNKKPNRTKNCKENENIKANLRHPLKSKIWRVFYTILRMTECQSTPPAHKLTQPPNYDMEMG